MKPVTGKGQLSIGDKIKIVARTDKDNYESVEVKNIVDNGYGEEIIINKKKNYYFVTKMMLAGESWAKEVYKLEREA